MGSKSKSIYTLKERNKIYRKAYDIFLELKNKGKLNINVGKLSYYKRICYCIEEAYREITPRKKT